jgi:hypothetical protein
MLPALLAVNGNKKVYRLLRTAFDESSISSFLGDMMAGLGRNSVYDFTPQLDKEAKKPAKKADDDVKEEL